MRGACGARPGASGEDGEPNVDGARGGRLRYSWSGSSETAAGEPGVPTAKGERSGTHVSGVPAGAVVKGETGGTRAEAILGLVGN